MKNPRFFLENVDLNQTNIEINDENVIHQIRNVLRLKEGDKLTLFNKNNEEVSGHIQQVMKKKLVFSKEIMKKKSKSSKVLFVLYPSMIKKDKLEYVLQKCTEIGVGKFGLLISERTEKLGFNLGRAEKIIKEATEQSGQTILPPITPPQSISELMLQYETHNNSNNFCETKNRALIYLDIGVPLLKIDTLRKEVTNDTIKEIHVYVGPEGGWSEKDKAEFKKAGVKPASLGDVILRAETASIAISSLILLPKIL